MGGVVIQKRALSSTSRGTVYFAALQHSESGDSNVFEFLDKMACGHSSET